MTHHAIVKVSLVIALLSCLPHTRGQVISPPQASTIFVSASSSVFRATARVFDCLSDARQGRQSTLSGAVELLSVAVGEYKKLADDRGGREFAKRGEAAMDGAIAQVNRLLASSPPPDWTKIQTLSTEGIVAQLNIDAINQLLKQLQRWKSCREPSGDVKEYIAFIRIKINLELVSQVAEIAFKN